MSFRLNIPCANTIMICVKVLKKNWNKGSKWRLQQFMPYIKNFLHKIWTFQIVIVRWLGIGINHCEVNIWYAEIPTSKIVHKSLTSLHPRYFTHLTLNCKTNLVILWNLKMFLLIHEIAWLAKGNVDESSLVVGLPTCPRSKNNCNSGWYLLLSLNSLVFFESNQTLFSNRWSVKMGV
jgi:hypothetical protein